MIETMAIMGIALVISLWWVYKTKDEEVEEEINPYIEDCTFYGGPHNGEVHSIDTRKEYFRLIDPPSEDIGLPMDGVAEDVVMTSSLYQRFEVVNGRRTFYHYNYIGDNK